MPSVIGIIGGSGFYNFVENLITREISTPFGNVLVEIGDINQVETIFIPRHGKNHRVAPSQINYRANIFALNSLKVDFILTTNAVGGLTKDFAIGDLVVADQILDFTSNRESTFFDGSDLQITTRTGQRLNGVIHTDVSHAYTPSIRNLIIETAKSMDIKLHTSGTMVVSNGPRFESPAEIKAYRILGGDFVGMTSAPEVFLAKELEIPYATIAVITNYGAGLQERVSADEVFELFSKRIEVVKSLIKRTITASKGI